MSENTSSSADELVVGAQPNGADPERIAAAGEECNHCDGRFDEFCVNCRRHIVPPGHTLFHVAIVIGSLHSGSYGEASLSVPARDEVEAERIARERTAASGLPMSGDGIDESTIRVYVTRDDSSPRVAGPAL